MAGIWAQVISVADKYFSKLTNGLRTDQNIGINEDPTATEALRVTGDVAVTGNVGINREPTTTNPLIVKISSGETVRFESADGSRYTTVDENSDVLVTGDMDILDIDDLGSESLDETDFATHAAWDVTGDFDDSSGAAVYTHSTGAGTLTQQDVNMTVAGVNNAWYVLEYDVSGVTAGCSAEITSAFALTAQTLSLTAGTGKTLVFKSAAAASTADFVISVTSTAGGFTLDNLSLKQVTGGDLKASGSVLAGGVAVTGAITATGLISSDTGVKVSPSASGVLLKKGDTNLLHVKRADDSTYASLVALAITAVSSSVYAKQFQPDAVSADLVLQLRNDSYDFSFCRTDGLEMVKIDATGVIQPRTVRTSNPTYGGAVDHIKQYQASSGALSGATGTITLNIPDGAVILAAQLKVKTLITSGDGGTDFNAAFSGGATDAIGTAVAFAKNTAQNKAYAGIETAGTTQITLTCAASGVAGGETFSAGEVVAVVLVREITADLTDFA